MTEALFFLSVGFFGYLVYVLVDEQRALTPGVPGVSAVIEETVTAVKPSKAKPPRKTATAAKAKPATSVKKPAAKPVAVSADPVLAKTKAATAAKAKPAASVKKPVAKPIAVSADPVLTYLGKNGLTTIAKISRELPESRKLIQDRIDRLVQEGAITLTTVRNAKAVTLKV
jgi:hypothetical protein